MNAGMTDISDRASYVRSSSVRAARHHDVCVGARGFPASSHLPGAGPIPALQGREYELLVVARHSNREWFAVYRSVEDRMRSGCARLRCSAAWLSVQRDIPAVCAAVTAERRRSSSSLPGCYVDSDFGRVKRPHLDDSVISRTLRGRSGSRCSEAVSVLPRAGLRQTSATRNPLEQGFAECPARSRTGFTA